MKSNLFEEVLNSIYDHDGKWTIQEAIEVLEHKKAFKYVSRNGSVQAVVIEDADPLKEEEGECRIKSCTGDSECLEHCPCDCHQEKETEYNPFEVTEEKVREAAEKGAKDQNEKYGKETPKKLPSKVDFYSTPDTDCAVRELKEAVNGIINFLDQEYERKEK